MGMSFIDERGSFIGERDGSSSGHIERGEHGDGDSGECRYGKKGTKDIPSC